MCCVCFVCFVGQTWGYLKKSLVCLSIVGLHKISLKKSVGGEVQNLRSYNMRPWISYIYLFDFWKYNGISSMSELRTLHGRSCASLCMFGERIIYLIDAHRCWSVYWLKRGNGERESLEKNICYGRIRVWFDALPSYRECACLRDGLLCGLPMEYVNYCY